MYEQSSAKAEISQLKSHTSDRANVPQLVRVVGVEDVPQFGDTDLCGDEDNVLHFVDYWKNSRSETPCSGGAQAAAPSDAVLDPVPVRAPAPAPAPSRAPDAASDIINVSLDNDIAHS